jgi:hypothetical protein
MSITIKKFSKIKDPIFPSWTGSHLHGLATTDEFKLESVFSGENSDVSLRSFSFYKNERIVSEASSPTVPF